MHADRLLERASHGTAGTEPLLLPLKDTGPFRRIGSTALGVPLEDEGCAVIEDCLSFFGPEGAA